MEVGVIFPHVEPFFAGPIDAHTTRVAADIKNPRNVPWVYDGQDELVQAQKAYEEEEQVSGVITNSEGKEMRVTAVIFDKTRAEEELSAKIKEQEEKRQPNTQNLEFFGLIPNFHAAFFAGLSFLIPDGLVIDVDSTNILRDTMGMKTDFALLKPANHQAINVFFSEEEMGIRSKSLKLGRQWDYMRRILGSIIPGQAENSTSAMLELCRVIFPLRWATMYGRWTEIDAFTLSDLKLIRQGITTIEPWKTAKNVFPIGAIVVYFFDTDFAYANTENIALVNELTQAPSEIQMPREVQNQAKNEARSKKYDVIRTKGSGIIGILFGKGSPQQNVAKVVENKITGKTAQVGKMIEGALDSATNALTEKTSEEEPSEEEPSEEEPSEE